jgi:outer membrane protein TolC
LLQKNFISAQIGQTRLRSDSLQTKQIVSQRELEKAIIGEYLSSYDTLSQIRFEEQTLAQLENQLSLLEPLVRNGIVLQTDYRALEIQVQTEKINIRLLKSSYRSSLYSLNALCGIPDTTVLEMAQPDLAWKTSTTLPIRN